MIYQEEHATLLLLVSNEETRGYLYNLLVENHYSPLVAHDSQAILHALKGKQCATVFVDCEAVNLLGARIYPKIKLGCPCCRVVLICDKTHKAHRGLIKEAMEIGVYACLLPPYEDWEVLTMVRHYPRKEPPRRNKKVI